MQSKRTTTFKHLLKALPLEVRNLARKNYKLWLNDMSHPSIKFKCVDKNLQKYSARVGAHYRALAIKDDDTVIWTWIGSHEDYNNLL